MKKILISLVVVMMMFSVIVFAESESIFIMPNEYKDISGSVYKDVIEKLSNAGIINGYSDGTFRPNEYVTRAQITKLIEVILPDNQSSYPILRKQVFDDVPLSHWASDYIQEVSSLGIIIGDGEGNFRPEDKVTYCEIFAMMSRILRCEGELIKSEEWPTNYINLAKKLEFNKDIIEIDYTNYATREQVAQLMYNMINISIDNNTTIAQRYYTNLLRDNTQ